MNKSLLTIFIATLSLSITGNALAGAQRLKAETSPFSETVNVTLAGIPSGVASIQYTNSNGVNISGPASSGNATFQMQIASNNLSEDGQPSMVVTYNNAVCQIQFNDGPWDFLTFVTGSASTPPTPPMCDSHFTVSAIDTTHEISNLYSFSITYRD